MSDAPPVRRVLIRGDEMMNPRGKPKTTPCATCPCRTANDGLVTGRGEEWDVFFRAETREAVWNGTWDQDDPDSALSNGGVNFCHQQHKYPCAGTLVLQQRELLRVHAGETHELSARGVERVATRMLNGGERREDETVHYELLQRLPRQQLIDAAHPAIADPNIGFHHLTPPQPGEFDALGHAVPAMPITLGPREGGGHRMMFYAYRGGVGRSIGFFYLDPDRRIPNSSRIGFKVTPGERGQGLGTEILKLGLYLAFERYGMHHLWLTLLERQGSEHAARVAKALGFARRADAGLPRTLTMFDLHRRDWKGSA